MNRFFFLLSSLFLLECQEPLFAIDIFKIYPFSALKDEVRIGLERQTKSRNSIEYGIGYFFKTYEPANCSECFGFPGFDSYLGNGGAIRVNWITYSDSAKLLTGFYKSIGLTYKYISLNRPDGFPYGPRIPLGYCITNQHLLYIQALIGKQYTSNTLAANIYGGLSIYGELNYYEYLGRPFAESKINNPRLFISASVNLGISFGYIFRRSLADVNYR